jgi:hypothetical protein
MDASGVQCRLRVVTRALRSGAVINVPAPKERSVRLRTHAGRALRARRVGCGRCLYVCADTALRRFYVHSMGEPATLPPARDTFALSPWPRAVRRTSTGQSAISKASRTAAALRFARWRSYLFSCEIS